MKKIIAIMTAAVMSIMLSLSCFADAVVGASSGNPTTGVNLDWLPIAICGGIVVVVGVISFIIAQKSKKKGKKK